MNLCPNNILYVYVGEGVLTFWHRTGGMIRRGLEFLLKVHTLGGGC